jgi:hypothetical protein
MGRMTVKKAKRLLAEAGLPTDINVVITNSNGISQGYYPNGIYPGAWHTFDHAGFWRMVLADPQHCLPPKASKKT